MHNKYYLAFDVGTTNWKAAIYNEQGQQQDIERCAAITHTDREGYSYYDPRELWDCLKKLAHAVIARNRFPIAAVSVASLAEAIVPLDSEGQPTDQIITWYDTRSVAEAKEFSRLFGPEAIFAVTGLDANPIFSLPKIMWVRKHKPAVYAAAVKWLQLHDYVLFCLCGEIVTDYTMACRTLAFDVMKNDWSDDILQRLGMSREVLPRIVQSGTVVGTVWPSICAEWGLTAAPKVVVGGHDHPCAAIVTGAVAEAKVLDSSGTAEAYLYISAPGAVPDMTFRGQRTARYLEKDRYVLWGGIIASGRSFDWAYDLFTSQRALGRKQDKVPFTAILPQLADVKGIEQGLIYYPHIRGAGAPYWDARMRGSFLGIRDHMDNRHFLRAVLEGLCMQSRMILAMHEQVSGRPIDSICVVGGSSKNRLWQQLKANITQKRVELSFEPEATLMGAAMLAAIGDGEYRSIAEVSGLLSGRNEVIMPDETLAGHFDAYYEIYRSGYECLEKLNITIDEMIN